MVYKGKQPTLWMPACPVILHGLGPGKYPSLQRMWVFGFKLETEIRRELPTAGSRAWFFWSSSQAAHLLGHNVLKCSGFKPFLQKNREGRAGVDPAAAKTTTKNSLKGKRCRLQPTPQPVSEVSPPCPTATQQPGGQDICWRHASKGGSPTLRALACACLYSTGSKAEPGTGGFKAFKFQTFSTQKEEKQVCGELFEDPTTAKKTASRGTRTAASLRGVPPRPTAGGKDKRPGHLLAQTSKAASPRALGTRVVGIPCLPRDPRHPCQQLPGAVAIWGEREKGKDCWGYCNGVGLGLGIHVSSSLRPLQWGQMLGLLQWGGEPQGICVSSSLGLLQ